MLDSLGPQSPHRHSQFVQRSGNCRFMLREPHLGMFFSTEGSFGPYDQTGQKVRGMPGTMKELAYGHSPESDL